MVKLSFFLLLLPLLSCSASQPQLVGMEKPVDEASALPMLHIQPKIYDLGDIQEGEAAIATFLIRNNSGQSIELVDIQASCGCTAAEPDSYMISPSGFTQLKVAIDTSAKQFDIKKSVYVTDSLGNTAKAMLVFNVVENPHLQSAGKIKGIFDGQCASCHFEPLVNTIDPKTLYDVGCAMCHGEQGVGAYAPRLTNLPSLTFLSHTIAHGVGRPQMPGFSHANGGPLTDAQIQSLAEWLYHLPKEADESLSSNPR
ncbi:MAG: DUF1573 domain-containing protein [Ghiorsea sp.]|nr:DUF1573 domain-containing protein [Ghiorsea sp.]